MTAVDKSPLIIETPSELAEARGLGQQIEIMVEAAQSKAHPIANTSGYSPRYRREMIKVYVKQAITMAAAIASEKGEIN